MSGLAKSPSRPSRESLKTPSRAESRVALSKTESLNIENCCNLVVKGDKYSSAKVGSSPQIVEGILVFFGDLWSDFRRWPVQCSTMLIF